MNINVGERYSNEIEVENYGAYMIDHLEEPVYIVQWIYEPRKTDMDRSEMVDGETYEWNKENYICRDNWLERFDGKRNWYTKEVYQNRNSRTCIFNLQKVASANIDMRPFTEAGGSNPLPRDVSRI